MQIIDAHTHCYPQTVYQNPRNWAESRGEHHWADLVSPLGKRSIQAWATPMEMLRAMDTAGVERAVLLGWYWERSATCRWHNDAISHWLREAPDRFIGFATLHPADEPDALSAELDRVADLGFVGVGELHPGVQGFDARTEGWLAVADWCSKASWPVNFHATEIVGPPHAGNVATPMNDFLLMAEQHPDLCMILSHWGGGLPFFEQNSHVRRVLKNVYYDAAASPLLYDPTIFRVLIELVGIDKLIFGSDYPLRIFPKQQSTADFKHYLEYIRNLSGLNPDELEALFAGNFRRIMGLSHQPFKD